MCAAVSVRTFELLHSSVIDWKSPVADVWESKDCVRRLWALSEYMCQVSNARDWRCACKFFVMRGSHENAVTYLIQQSCVWSLSPLNDVYTTYLSIVCTTCGCMAMKVSSVAVNDVRDAVPM